MQCLAYALLHRSANLELHSEEATKAQPGQLLIRQGPLQFGPLRHSDTGDLLDVAP